MPGLQISGKLEITGTTGDVLTIDAPTAPGFIRITSLYVSVSATSTVKFSSGSNEIAAALLGTTNVINMVNPTDGVLDCEPGATFVINNSAGTIRGFLNYVVKGVG